MLAWARLILNRGAAPGGRLLTEESFGLWTGKVIEDPDEPGTFYGYGLVTRTLDGHECIGHSGGMVGFTSLLVTDAACGIGVIVLLNGSDERLEIARFALAALRAAAAGAQVPPPRRPPTRRSSARRVPSTPASTSRRPRAAAPRAAGGVAAPGPRAGAPPGPGDGDPAVGALTFVAHDDRLFLCLPAAPAVGVGTAAVERTAAGRSGAGPAGDTPSAGEIALERRGDDLFLAPHPDWDRFHLRFERDDGGAVVALSFGPAWLAREGRAPQAAPAPDPSWARLTGTYRSYDPWNPVFRVVSRRGRLLMVAPWLSPDDELELVPLSGGGFRVGAPGWLPDQGWAYGLVEGPSPSTSLYPGRAPDQNATRPAFWNSMRTYFEQGTCQDDESLLLHGRRLNILDRNPQ